MKRILSSRDCVAPATLDDAVPFRDDPPAFIPMGMSRALTMALDPERRVLHQRRVFN